MWSTKSWNLRYLLCACVVIVTLYIIIFSIKTTKLLSNHIPQDDQHRNVYRDKARLADHVITTHGPHTLSRYRPHSTATARVKHAVVADTLGGKIYYNKTLEINVNSRISMEDTQMFKNNSVKKKVENLEETKLSIKKSYITRELWYNHSNQGDVSKHKDKLQVEEYQEVWHYIADKKNQSVRSIVKTTGLPDVQSPDGAVKTTGLPNVQSPDGAVKTTALPNIRSPEGAIKTTALPNVQSPEGAVKTTALPNVKLSSKVTQPNNILQGKHSNLKQSQKNKKNTESRSQTSNGVINKHVLINSSLVTRSRNMTSEVVMVTPTTQAPVLNHLRNYSTSLYEKAINILKNHNCSAQQKDWLNNIVDLTLCGKPSHTEQTLVVMVTSMYHHNGKQFIFSNTLSNWPLLQPIIQPVLYISELNVIEKSGDLIHKACHSGWVVTFAPRCNANGYPVLVDMVTHSISMWPGAQWVGFANGDILFGVDLLDTIKQLPEMELKPGLLVARRWNVYLDPGTSVYSTDNVTQLKQSADLHPVTGIDLFIFNTQTYPFKEIPAFVIGRPGFDNWLVYYSLHVSMTVVDVTQTVTCLHQGTSGISWAENSHTHKTQDLNYNFKFMSPSTLVRGFINCVSYYLYYNKNTTTIDQTYQIVLSHRTVQKSCINSRAKKKFFNKIARDIPGFSGMFLNRRRPDVGGKVPRIVALSVIVLSCVILLSALLTCCLYPE